MPYPNDDYVSVEEMLRKQQLEQQLLSMGYTIEEAHAEVVILKKIRFALMIINN